MALAVTIHKGIDPLLRGRDVPRKQWRALVLERAGFCRDKFKHDCRQLLFFVADGRENEFFGYPDEETYLRKGLYLDPLTVSVVADYLRTHGDEVPIPFDEAVALGKWGVNQHTGGDSNTTSSIGRGRAYILARLERDGHAELAAKVRANTMSANAAAIEAGFRKKLSPFEQVLRLLDKLTPDELRSVHYATDERHSEAAE